MISLRNVSKDYGGSTKALESVTLAIEKGEFVFIVGPSGAGKSTLIKLLYREETPSTGQVVVLGKDLAKLRRREIPFLRRRIGVVFQDFKLLEDKTVGENISFALEVTGTPTREIKKRVAQVLNLVGLKDRRDAYPNELSGGEQQRIAIARALVRNPDVLLADEPSGNLDPKTAHEIFSLLERANMYGTTVVVATHAQDMVNLLKKRVIELRNGTVVRDERRGAYSS
ncbi:MAG: cell division ATP-binding protein FtsE [Firmicutes bacterium]|nr:cell division ATP-binding protein FtsE [Candidatus Fermentithermobacillaceae bacterium]HON86873.1 cell division ATP-binding protein FtsE [Bacillota bacterium]HOV65737.1 cell division ATP-binding protein FtsE [Bacillota bacterium]HRC52948.1 cell division ATP-binding protein FtsE [Bacillota bacterium]